MTPTTKAGRTVMEMLSGWRPLDRLDVSTEFMGVQVLAIEAEARAALLAEIRREVEALPVELPEDFPLSGPIDWIGPDSRRSILALLARLDKP